jgi:hypothetical protein
MTAPVHGFLDEVDYWTRASSGPYVSAIRRPTLLISALDDPFVPVRALPDAAALPPLVRTAYAPRGGHVGFIEGRWPWRVHSWAERCAVAFVADVLQARPPGDRRDGRTGPGRGSAVPIADAAAAPDPGAPGGRRAAVPARAPGLR